jgi:H+/Na+-translocating ferredoxin:NAD+ oxidoreductase subunit D
MTSDAPKLVLATSPFLKRPVDTPLIMRHVIYGLVPTMLAAAYFYGMSALLIILACGLGCVSTEWVIKGRRPLRESTVSDGSAAVTGVLLALTLPPGLPLWMAFFGGAVAIVLGKLLFGGLGQNVFNPSLVGRAFLQACFPISLTTWSAHRNLDGFFTVESSNLALPFLTPHVDAVTAATPLARMKFESLSTPILDLLVGSHAGSLGETSTIMILLGGAYLAYRRFLNWRIPAGIFVSAFALATVLHLSDPKKFPDGIFHLLSGGMVLGAVFMATDPVTSPLTPLGCWIFAAGVGVLVILIRQFSGLPEGVMYSILLMNALTPLIDRIAQPRTYGTGRVDSHAS